MGIVMGPNQFGKAEVRLVAVNRDAERHVIRDLTVSTALRGELESAHYTGDNRNILTTDTQKNTVYAFAKEAPVGEIEDFALRLARHFVDSQQAITGARVTVDEHAWERVPVGGATHDHSFSRAGEEKRSTTVTIDGKRTHVVSGLKDLVLLKSTGSEFWGFPKDKYTTLAEATDRILATAVTARWRYEQSTRDWSTAFTAIRSAMLESFATTHSYALQQSLYEMGKGALRACPDVAEVRLSLPNKHHFLVDLTPFELSNDNEVFFAADRPYGLIEGTVEREESPSAPQAWSDF